MASDDNPLSFIGKFLDSTPFLICVLIAIAGLAGWAIWRH